MAFRVVFRDKQIGRQYRLRMYRHARNHRRAELLAASDALDQMLRLGRANIAAAGRFGSRWTDGLRGQVRRQGGNVVINIIHDVPYFTVFQFGKVIHGHPLLWIPFSHATDAFGVRARDFPAPLFRVDRGGGKAPLLLSVVDKEPKYFGKESVTIPKKFQVFEIVEDISSRMGEFYRRRFAELS